MIARVVRAIAVCVAALALAACGQGSSEQAGSPPRPHATGPFHCPSPAFVSTAVGFDVARAPRPQVGCLYNDVADPDAHWVAIDHEPHLYRGQTLAAVSDDIVSTLERKGLGLITSFPEGGAQAFRFGSPPTSCQYWVYLSDGVPGGVDSIDGHAQDCESARRLAEAVALK